jgi:hypothetical protein
MHNTYTGMIGRQDAPPHEQGALIQLHGIIVLPEPGIHVGQNSDGISCVGARQKRANQLSNILIANYLFQDDSQVAAAAESLAFASVAPEHRRACRHQCTRPQDCALK